MANGTCQAITLFCHGLIGGSVLHNETGGGGGLSDPIWQGEPAQGVRSHALAIYKQVDRHMEKEAARLGATCKKGCAACCYQLVGLTLVEATAIGEWVLRNRPPEEIDRILIELDAASARMLGTSLEASFLDRKPCAFLKDVNETGPYTGLCSIYPVRPLACRVQYVVSHPRFCRPDKIYECMIVGSLEVSVKALDALSMGEPVLQLYGPFAPFVAIAIRFLQTGERLPRLEIDNWCMRMRKFINHDRAIQERTGRTDRIIK